MILLNGVIFRTRMKIGKSAAAAAVLYFRSSEAASCWTAQASRHLTVWLAHAQKSPTAQVCAAEPGERRGARSGSRGPELSSVIPNRVVLPRNLRQLFVFQPAILIRFPRQWQSILLPLVFSPQHSLWHLSVTLYTIEVSSEDLVRT